MSYKYLYGVSSELSYDFSKVIYFGKQDRGESTLFRITEHYRMNDPNCEEFKKAKYLLIAQVDLGTDLSDLEAYFIQKYRPSLNTIYNNDKGHHEKLNAKELSDIQHLAEILSWTILRNSAASTKDLDKTFDELKSREDAIKNAGYVFDSEEALLNTPCKEAIRLLSKGAVLIKPEIENTILCPLHSVDADEENVYIDYFRRTRYRNSTHYKTLPYQSVIKPHFIPELKLATKQIITAEKEYFGDEMTTLDTAENLREYLLDLWLILLYFLSKDLAQKEPSFSKNLTFETLCKGIDFIANFNGGFNSKNWGIIRSILQLFFLHKYEDDLPVCNFQNMFDFKSVTYEIKAKKITDFLSEYADSFSDISAEDQLTSGLTFKDWINESCA